MGIVILILGILSGLTGVTMIGASFAFDAPIPQVVVIPPMPQVAPEIQDAYDDAWCEFTNLFNSYETKWSKNNRLMIRQGDSGSFKFVKKG